MKKVALLLNLFLLTSTTNFAHAAISVHNVNVVGLTCDSNPQNGGEGQDFNLAFSWAPLKGMFDTRSINGHVEKSVESDTNNRTGLTTLFVSVKHDTGSEIEVLRFKTSDLFNNIPFHAQVYKGPKNNYSPKRLINTICQAPNGLL